MSMDVGGSKGGVKVFRDMRSQVRRAERVTERNRVRLDGERTQRVDVVVSCGSDQHPPLVQSTTVHALDRHAVEIDAVEATDVDAPAGESWHTARRLTTVRDLGRRNGRMPHFGQK